MATAQVVPAFAELEHFQSCIILMMEATSIQQFAFKRGEKALRHRVIEAFADLARRRAYAVFPATVPEGNRRILTALVNSGGYRGLLFGILSSYRFQRIGCPPKRVNSSKCPCPEFGQL